MKLAKLLTFQVESFSSLGFNFEEYVIKTKCSPEVLVQLLAFGGTAHGEEGETVSVEDWKLFPGGVMEELRMTVFTSFQTIPGGWRAPAVDGVFALTSVSTKATVQKGGVISLPDYKTAKKHATNRRFVTLIG